MKKNCLILFLVATVFSSLQSFALNFVCYDSSWNVVYNEPIEPINGDDIYSFTKELKTGWRFSFVDETADAYHWYGAGLYDTQLTMGQPVDVQKDNGNGQFLYNGENGVYRINYDPQSSTVTLEPSGLWLRGNLSKYGFSASEGEAFVSNDYGATWDLSVNVTEVGQKYYSLTRMLMEQPDDLDGLLNHTYGGFNGVLNVLVNNPTHLKDVGGYDMYTDFPETGIYQFNFVVATNTLTIIKRISTTVDDVTKSKTEISRKYVNLNGQMSEQPFDGVNIVVSVFDDGSSCSHKVATK